jgi:hypothetical protein
MVVWKAKTRSFHTKSNPVDGQNLDPLKVIERIGVFWLFVT